jgi:hypothetical protein
MNHFIAGIAGRSQNAVFWSQIEIVKLLLEGGIDFVERIASTFQHEMARHYITPFFLLCQ